MTKKDKLTKVQKRLRKAIRRFNAYLDLDQMARTFDAKDWNLFIRLVNEGGVSFSGDPTGFHLETEVGETWHSAARDKDLRRAYPPGLMLPQTLREHEARFRRFNEWLVNQHAVPPADMGTAAFAAKEEWSRILTAMNEFLEGDRTA